jgi:hypothetical protein
MNKSCDLPTILFVNCIWHYTLSSTGKVLQGKFDHGVVSNYVSWSVVLWQAICQHPNRTKILSVEHCHNQTHCHNQISWEIVTQGIEWKSQSATSSKNKVLGQFVPRQFYPWSTCHWTIYSLGNKHPCWRLLQQAKQLEHSIGTNCSWGWVVWGQIIIGEQSGDELS